MASSSAGKAIFLYALFLLALGAAAALGLRHIMQVRQGGALDGERYYRAVYVLQSLGGPAAREHEDIPPRIAYLDETESLLHHSDKIQVLERVAGELAETGMAHPKAQLFEAYARLSLGEREQAAALLTRYVVESEYQAGHYSLLTENLYALQDYTSLLLICREWQERDSGCRENRAYYLWAALFNLGRYADASASLEREGDCLGWRAGVYAAKSALAQGQEEEAEALAARAEERYPAEVPLIRRLWQQLRDRAAV